MDFQNIIRTVLRLIFAAGGLIFLFNGSFSKMQFGGRVSLEGMCFIILSLGFGLFVFKPLKCNDMFEKLCNMHFLVNAVVKFLLLGLFSMVIFFTKYPGLKILRSEGKRSLKAYDLLGVGSFSVFALLISWERQHGGSGFGIFEYMLELTMDASMEIPAGDDDGSGPNLWYMVGAYVYCFLLLSIRSYGNSLSTEQRTSNSVGRQETLLRDQNDQPLGTDLDAIDLERGSENNHGRLNNLGNYEVDGLRNRRRLQDQNDQLGTNLDAIDMERGSENNFLVDGLRNRRRLQDRNDQPDADSDSDLHTLSRGKPTSSESLVRKFIRMKRNALEEKGRGISSAQNATETHLHTLLRGKGNSIEDWKAKLALEEEGRGISSAQNALH